MLEVSLELIDAFGHLQVMQSLVRLLQLPHQLLPFDLCLLQPLRTIINIIITNQHLPNPMNKLLHHPLTILIRLAKLHLLNFERFNQLMKFLIILLFLLNARVLGRAFLLLGDGQVVHFYLRC